MLNYPALTNYFDCYVHAGFTPMVRVARDALSSQLANREQALATSSSSAVNSTQEKRVGGQQAPVAKSAKLLFANKMEKDILWREELDQFAKTTQGR